MAKRVPVIPLETLLEPPIWVRYYRARVAWVQSLYGGTQGFKACVAFVLLQILIIASGFALIPIISPLPSWLFSIIVLIISPIFYIIPIFHMTLAKAEWNTPLLRTVGIHVLLVIFSILIQELFFV